MPNRPKKERNKHEQATHSTHCSVKRCLHHMIARDLSTITSCSHSLNGKIQSKKITVMFASYHNHTMITQNHSFHVVLKNCDLSDYNVQKHTHQPVKIMSVPHPTSIFVLYGALRLVCNRISTYEIGTRIHAQYDCI